MISRLELRKSICNTDAFREKFLFAAAQFQKQQKGVGFIPSNTKYIIQFSL